MKDERKHRVPIKKKDLNPNPLPLSLPLPAETTEQQDITHAGQRRINLIWEYTQAFLALFMTVAVTGLGVFLAVQGRIDDVPPFLTLMVGLIIGTYFQRTNHEKIGGTGPKPGSYQGR